MPEEKYQEREAERLNDEARKESGEKVCSSCSSHNDEEAMFCVQCGKGFEVPVKPCPVCGEMSSGDFCESCGSSIEGRICPECNTLQYRDFCENCGAPVSPMAVNGMIMAAAPVKMREMAEEEAREIIRDLKESLSPDMRKEQDKKRERLLYQFEKEYCSERDERMGTYQAAQGIKLRVIDGEEMELIKKSIERLGGYVARENELIDEEIHFREEEQKKSEEVRIQAEKERVEKERKEHERFMNRIDGVWISTARWIEIMKLNLRDNTLSGTSHWKIDNRECVFTLSGTWDGNNFYIQSTAIRNISGKSGHFTFCGTVNKTGKILNGYFIDNTKEKTQQIFIKQ